MSFEIKTNELLLYMPKKLLILLSVVFLQSCFLFTKDPPKPIVDPVETLPEFDSVPIAFSIENGIIDEASGIDASETMADHVWIHEDGNTTPGVHLFTNKGEYKGRMNVPFPNRDWEDMAVGPGPIDGQSYIYLADIGDNFENYSTHFIYRLKEPRSFISYLADFDKITFAYPNNERYDAETMLLDSKTKDIYIITKRQFNVRVYKLAYPQSTTTTITAEFLKTIPYLGIVGGDISSDGKEMVLKSYDAAYYWKIKEGESVIDALSRTRDVGLPYVQEVQGEAICFDKTASGYFTISERAETNVKIPLNYYKKK